MKIHNSNGLVLHFHCCYRRHHQKKNPLSNYKYIRWYNYYYYSCISTGISTIITGLTSLIILQMMIFTTTTTTITKSRFIVFVPVQSFTTIPSRSYSTLPRRWTYNQHHHGHHHHLSRSLSTSSPALRFTSNHFGRRSIPMLAATRSSSSSSSSSSSASSSSSSSSLQPPFKLNLSTVTLNELESLMLNLKVPKYRGQQIYHYIRNQGVTDISQMILLPKALRQQLQQLCTSSSLVLVQEQVSKVDGTIKRVYELHDNTLIESVLMGPYQDGRYTACISSQVGCAQGCIFCATGQMGFTRQLTSHEIFEQVATFHALLLSSSKSSSKSSPNNIKDTNNDVTHGKSKRLSNVVFMGMGEPLANYKNVITATNRIIHELGIGARRITISTVGIVPIIRKITHDSSRRSLTMEVEDNNGSRKDTFPTSESATTNDTLLPQFRLAISLHSATEDERTALLPANARNGGLNALMESLREYCDVTGRRITIEWALIAGQNDNIQTAQQLGRLLVRHPKYPLRPDLVHVNVIPLNPTAMYQGKPSQAGSVNVFCQTLINEFGISCTPRVRRGIDIDAGCGQLTTKYRESKQQQQQQDDDDDDGVNNTPTASLRDFIPQNPIVGVYDDDEDDTFSDEDRDDYNDASVSVTTVDWDDNNNDDMTIELINNGCTVDPSETDRLISLVQGTTISLSDLDQK